jgi:hypothetical protein
MPKKNFSFTRSISHLGHFLVIRLVVLINTEIGYGRN